MCAGSSQWPIELTGTEAGRNPRPNSVPNQEKCSQPLGMSGWGPWGVSRVTEGWPGRDFTMRPIWVMGTPAIWRGRRAEAGAVKSSS